MKCLHLFSVCLVILCFGRSSLCIVTAVDDADFPMKNKTEFMNLNLDVQLLIIEHLNLPNLIALAEINEYFGEITANVFRRKYHNKTIKFVNYYMDDRNYINYWDDSNAFNVINDVIVESNDSLVFQHSGTTLKMLKYFGHVITKLEIVFTLFNLPPEKNVHQIYQLVNLHCSESLTELYIRYDSRDNVFDQMIKPFKKVEKLSVNTNQKMFDTATIPFEKLFPVLKSLAFENVPVGNIINRHFPHLINLSIRVWTPNHPQHETEGNVKPLFQLNPQIRQLRLNYCTRSFLKFVNEVLPNLTDLAVEYYHTDSTFDENAPIVFGNVKNFTFFGLFNSIPYNIEFEQLEEFNTNAFKCDRWLNLVGKSKTLRKLKVYKGSLSNEKLEMLVVGSNLTEVDLALSRDVNAETIIEFIDKSENLQKIRLYTEFGLLEPVTNKLRERFDGQFVITASNNDILFLRRDGDLNETN